MEIDGSFTRLIVNLDQTWETNVGNTEKRIRLNKTELWDENGTKKINYMETSDLSGLRKISLWVQKGGESRRVGWGRDWDARLLRYLRGERDLILARVMSCYGFAFFMNRVYISPNKGLWEGDWEIEKINDEDEVPVMDSVVMSDAETAKDQIFFRAKHMAVSLGMEGLFLSKAGVSGRLIIENVNKMKEMFETKNVFRLRPRPESIDEWY